MDIPGAVLDGLIAFLSPRSLSTLLALMLTAALVADRFAPGTSSGVLAWLAMHFGSELKQAVDAVLHVIERQAMSHHHGVPVN